MMEEMGDYGESTAKHKINEISSEIIRTFEEKIELTKTIKNSKIGLEKFVEDDANEKLTLSAS
jgi:hypothetical protein